MDALFSHDTTFDDGAGASALVLDPCSQLQLPFAHATAAAAAVDYATLQYATAAAGLQQPSAAVAVWPGAVTDSDQLSAAMAAAAAAAYVVPMAPPPMLFPVGAAAPLLAAKEQHDLLEFIKHQPTTAFDALSIDASLSSSTSSTSAAPSMTFDAATLAAAAASGIVPGAPLLPAAFGVAPTNWAWLVPAAAVSTTSSPSPSPTFSTEAAAAAAAAYMFAPVAHMPLLPHGLPYAHLQHMLAPVPSTVPVASSALMLPVNAAAAAAAAAAATAAALPAPAVGKKRSAAVSASLSTSGDAVPSSPSPSPSSSTTTTPRGGGGGGSSGGSASRRRRSLAQAPQWQPVDAAKGPYLELFIAYLRCEMDDPEPVRVQLPLDVARLADDYAVELPIEELAQQLEDVKLTRQRVTLVARDSWEDSYVFYFRFCNVPAAAHEAAQRMLMRGITMTSIGFRENRPPYLVYFRRDQVRQDSQGAPTRVPAFPEVFRPGSAAASSSSGANKKPRTSFFNPPTLLPDGTLQISGELRFGANRLDLFLFGRHSGIYFAVEQRNAPAAVATSSSSTSPASVPTSPFEAATPATTPRAHLLAGPQ